MEVKCLTFPLAALIGKRNVIVKRYESKFAQYLM